GVRTGAGDPLRTLLYQPPRVPEAGHEGFESLRSTLADCLIHGASLPPSAEIARIRRFCESIIMERYSSPLARLQDIAQLEHIAAGYTARGRFLSELTPDP